MAPIAVPCSSRGEGLHAAPHPQWGPVAAVRTRAIVGCISACAARAACSHACMPGHLQVPHGAIAGMAHYSGPAAGAACCAVPVRQNAVTIGKAAADLEQSCCLCVNALALSRPGYEPQQQQYSWQAHGLERTWVILWKHNPSDLPVPGQLQHASRMHACRVWAHAAGPCMAACRPPEGGRDERATEGLPLGCHARLARTRIYIHKVFLATEDKSNPS